MPATDQDRKSARHPRRAALAAGALGAVATTALYLTGTGRSWDLDSSITVGLFVGTDSMRDAVTNAYVLNNHVALSVLDHLVHSITGSQGPVALRIVPILAAAITVWVLMTVLARRWGIAAAVVAGAVVATNPMFAEVSTAVRGYSLLALCALTATLLALRIEGAARAGEPGDRPDLVLYGLVVAIGFATHLYMGFATAIGLAAAARPPRCLRRLVPTAVAGAALGLLAYAGIWRTMWATTRQNGQRLRATYPLDLGWALLGASVVSVVGLLVVGAPELWARRRDRRLQLGAGAVILAVAALWLIARPFDLYPRFFSWLVPAVGVIAAAAFHRHRKVAGVVLALVVVAQLVVTIGVLRDDPLPGREAAALTARVERRGGAVCALGDYTLLRMLGYPVLVRELRRPSASASCPVVLHFGALTDRAADRSLNAAYPHQGRLRTGEGGQIWSKVPLSCFSATPPRSVDGSSACRLTGR